MKRSKFIKTVGQGLFVSSILPVTQLVSHTQSGHDGAPKRQKDRLRISGVYPHLAVFNHSDTHFCKNAGGECGIGALVPWADRLWLITYSPHCPEGSADKLYAIDEELNLVVRPESVGGTPANRMIHKESRQLIMGPYFIDKNRNVRVIPPQQMPGRLTAVMRHLEDPANRVYFFGMEGRLYEANVHTLESKLLFLKPVPGWHGKGGYTAQGKLILSNNGGPRNKVFDIEPGMLQVGDVPQNEEQLGVLAEWDGTNWSIVRRRQFTEVTGPGGLYGAPDDRAPAWSLGWDKRSVILMLLDRGEWTEFRLPKSTHTYDSPDGWYTEWPRIREVTDHNWLMDMHGMLFDFPSGFSSRAIKGIKPLCNHLVMITDFCNWRGEIALSTDQTSMMKNKFPGQSQSNLWFGSREDLSGWGPANGWGGVWLNDAVQAGITSPPFLMNGFEKKVLHLSHQDERTVHFTVEIFNPEKDRWMTDQNIAVGPGGYQSHVFPSAFKAEWVRVKTDLDCIATAYFHYYQRGYEAKSQEKIFSALAGLNESEEVGGLIRPAAHNRNLQFLHQTAKEQGRYFEIDEELRFHTVKDPRLSREVEDICKIEKDFDLDEASVLVKDKTGQYRLPRTSDQYDQPFSTGWPRGKREVITERSLFNVHGTFYEIADDTGMATMRPICTHRKKIIDFCSWRGLLVISGTKKGAAGDGHYFGENHAGLWFGAVDDLWKFGQPVGYGGPWKNTMVKAGAYSLPYLMTGYDKKRVELQADREVVISLEVDFDHQGWHLFKDFRIPAGKPIIYHFPEGYSAHWIRVKSDREAKASVQLYYT